jgi:CRP/FNR family transcriptional regulator, anaerobic regulatory protein
MAIEFLIQELEHSTLFNKQIVLKRNEFLNMAGQIDRNIYRVESGSLRIFRNDGHEEQIIRLSYTGDLIAPLDSFFTGNPTDFYMQAIKSTRVSVAPGEAFLDFIEQDINRMKAWVQVLQNLVIQQMEREVDLLTPSPLERYLRVLQRSPRLFQEIPNKHIANYLRMTPETLSRLKKS